MTPARMARQLKILGIALALALPAVLLACGSDEPSDGAAATPAAADQTATTAEREAPTATSGGTYSGFPDPKIAGYCEELAGVGDGEDEPQTWGEAARQTDRLRDRLEDITPPEELKDFHSATVALFNGLSDLYRSQGTDKPFVKEDGNSDPVTFGLALGVVAALGQLEEETRSQLENSDCGMSSLG